MANTSVQNLDRLIKKHNISEDKRAALLKLRPGMSYQQARQFYGNRDVQPDAMLPREDNAYELGGDDEVGDGSHPAAQVNGPNQKLGRQDLFKNVLELQQEPRSQQTERLDCFS